MKSLRPAAILVLFALLTLPLMPLQRLLLLLNSQHARHLPTHYHRLVLKLLGIRLHVLGTPIAEGPALLVSNHVSWLDIVVLSALAPLSFIAKREVGNWPFFGTLARLQRTVFVDRNRRHATAGSRDEIRHRLLQGDRLVLFAEGTSGDGGRVLPFKSSYFAAAEQGGVAVQPLTIAYSGHWGLPMNRRSRPFYAWYGDMDLGPHLWQALAAGPIEVTVVCHPLIQLPSDRKSMALAAERSVRNGLVRILSGAAVHTSAEIG